MIFPAGDQGGARRRSPQAPRDAASVLAAWIFPTPDGATHAQHIVDRPRHPTLVIDDMAVVSWPGSRPQPMAWQVQDLDPERQLTGAFWGLLFGLTLLLPLCGDHPVLGPSAATADSCLLALGLGPTLSRDLRENLVPGTSALLVLSLPTQLSIIGDDLQRFSVSPLVAGLTHEQVDRLRQGFGESR
jgi:uncharacterized membrane protein